MADYELMDGKGTKVTESTPNTEGYVDININNLTVATATVLDTDSLIAQTGAAEPVQVTKVQLLAMQGHQLTESYIY